MRIESHKIIFLFAIIIFIFAFWDQGIMKYWKNLSVLLHESFHAITGFLLGGQNIYIVLGNKENGTTIMENLPYFALPIVVSSGYLGNILLGSIILNQGFQFKKTKLISFLCGNWIFLVVLFFLDSNSNSFNTYLLTGIIMIILSFFGKFSSSVVVIFLSLTLILYGIYDIYDIFLNPYSTDAGIFARWMIEKKLISTGTKELSIQIGIIWYMISSLVIIFFNRFLFFGDTTGESRVDRMIVLVNEGVVSKDTADWFISNGKDIDGIPLSKENLKYIKGQNYEK